MKAFAHWHWSRLTAGVVLTLLFGAGLAPSTARASCGDYVLMTGTHAEAETRPLPDPGPVEKQPPCSGPLCSQGPFVPLPAPAAPVSLTGHQDWACTLAPPRVPGPGTFSYLPGDDTVRAVHRGSSIFHPPR